eukprot:TRINITY_DN2651_c2_g1_i2.p1 TRINITY_DN2651_c2_g1~~TRINITY_DN2651_c2_g1_i2.p1  ORF type:complete len:365 (-),score=104.83 TRINITY_DN2651_c2_g1_i2:260-1354(-)
MFDFKNISLKKTEKKEEKKIDLKEELEKEKQSQEKTLLIQRRVRECDLEEWYETLKEHTYKSTWIPVSIKQARALINANLVNEGIKTELNEGEINELNTLKNQITEAIKKFNSSGAFCKLSSRSPKDASMAGQRTEDLYRKYYTESKEKDDNAKVSCIYRAHIEALKCDNGDQCLEFFKRSERIKTDLELALENEKEWSQHVILREWVTIPISNEFRGFIYQNKLTALCQYYHHVYFQNLIDKKDEYLKRVQKFFEEVKTLFPKVLSEKFGNKNCSAVVDFVVDFENDKCYIIELNPFRDYEGNGTSSCMFDWEKDKSLLFGESPFEFRMEKQKVDNLIHNQVKSVIWRDLFNKVDNELGIQHN